jgi:hypothetical protein
MAVSPASVAVGKCYVRFTEVRRVTEVTFDGDVKYISRMKPNRVWARRTALAEPQRSSLRWK